VTNYFLIKEMDLKQKLIFGLKLLGILSLEFLLLRILVKRTWL